MSQNPTSDQKSKSFDDVSDFSDNRPAMRFSTERSLYLSLVENELSKYQIPEILIFALHAKALKSVDPFEKLVWSFFGIREDLSVENKMAQLVRLLQKLAEREKLIPDLIENFESILEDLKSTKVNIECDKRKMMNIMMQKQREIDDLRIFLKPKEKQIEQLSRENLDLNEKLILMQNKLDHKKVLIKTIERQHHKSTSSTSRNWTKSINTNQQLAYDLQVAKVQLEDLNKQKKEILEEIELLKSKNNYIQQETKLKKEQREMLEKKLEKLESKIANEHLRLRSLKGSGSLNISLEKSQESDFQKLINSIQETQAERDKSLELVQNLLVEEEALKQQFGKNHVHQKRLKVKLVAQDRSIKAINNRVNELSATFTKNGSISEATKNVNSISNLGLKVLRDFSRSNTQKSRETPNEVNCESAEDEESLLPLDSLKRGKKTPKDSSLSSPINRAIERPSTTARRNINIDFLLVNSKRSRTHAKLNLIADQMSRLSALFREFSESMSKRLEQIKHVIKIRLGSAFLFTRSLKDLGTEIRSIEALHSEARDLNTRLKNPNLGSVDYFKKLADVFEIAGVDMFEPNAVDSLGKQLLLLLKNSKPSSAPIFLSERTLRSGSPINRNTKHWVFVHDMIQDTRWRTASQVKLSATTGFVF